MSSESPSKKQKLEPAEEPKAEQPKPAEAEQHKAAERQPLASQGPEGNANASQEEESQCIDCGRTEVLLGRRCDWCYSSMLPTSLRSWCPDYLQDTKD